MKITNDLIKYNISTAVVVALEDKYKDVQITDGKSYAVVMAGLAEYRELRLKIDNKHKELKKDVLEVGRAIDGEKNRLKLLLEPGENHLKDIRNIEDARKATIKAEKEAKERNRIDSIRVKISNIQAMGNNLSIMPLKDLRELSNKLEKSEINTDEYMEFADEATKVLNDICYSVQTATGVAIQVEKRNAERKAEGERLEKVRREQEIAQAKIDKENRKIEEEKRIIDQGLRQIEAEKKAEKERKAREEFERQATIKAEQEAKENARQKSEEAEALAAVETEKAVRQAKMAPDKEKLIKFADELYDIEIPTVESTKAQKILSEARHRLGELAQDVRAKANKL